MAFFSGVWAVVLAVRAYRREARAPAGVAPLLVLTAGSFLGAFFISSTEGDDATNDDALCRNEHALTRPVDGPTGPLHCVFRPGDAPEAPTLGCSTGRADADALCRRVADITRAHPTASAADLQAAFVGAARDLGLTRVGEVVAAPGAR
ncbi:MAG: hypothetical protein H6704_12305 [Myxococcales bacterium]|nr:hypothetical protein [Myxococcales bacterium]